SQETADRIQRDGGNSARQRRDANFRLQLGHAIRRQLDGTGDGRHTGLAVDIDQADHIARKNQVWIVNLRIDVPDFWPKPRALEEPSGNIPEGVTLDHRITVRTIRLEIGLSR